MGPDHQVSLRNVSVRRGKLQALSAVDLQVDRGSSVALIGSNGSGKTTLLHVVAGLITPTSGSVTFHGVQSQVAYVLQQTNSSRWMPLTVSEVLRMGRYRHRGLLGPLRDADRSAVARAAERLEVSDLANRQFGELSGGQRQRVLVAQALAQEPQILLLDEPITGLDLPSQQRILDLIDAETRQGLTVMLATHHLDEARHCERVVVLANRIIDEGAPDDVLTPERLSAAFRGRVLGPHDRHDHAHELLMFDDHGHG